MEGIVLPHLTNYGLLAYCDLFVLALLICRKVSFFLIFFNYLSNQCVELYLVQFSFLFFWRFLLFGLIFGLVCQIFTVFIELNLIVLSYFTKLVARFRSKEGYTVFIKTNVTIIIRIIKTAIIIKDTIIKTAIIIKDTIIKTAIIIMNHPEITIIINIMKILIITVKIIMSHGHI